MKGLLFFREIKSREITVVNSFNHLVLGRILEDGTFAVNNDNADYFPIEWLKEITIICENFDLLFDKFILNNKNTHDTQTPQTN